MKKLLWLFIVLSQCVFARTFDFSLQGEHDANEIIKNFISSEFNIEDVQTIAYQHGSKILGIVKHGTFYTMEGYKLIVLEKEECGYIPIKCNIYFDNSKELTLDDNKITYYKSIFYKNKKQTVNLKNSGIKTNKSIGDMLTDKKMQKIENLTRHTPNEHYSCIDLSDFKTSAERKINIKYNNLNERTKHYIEMR